MQTLVKIAFYKSSGDLVDKTIRLLTKSQYSHCEIIYNDLWYSSSPRDKGVRKKVITEDNTKWDIFHIYIDEDRLQNIYTKYAASGYDFLGIFLSILFKFKIQDKNKVFCSEFLAEILGLAYPYMYTPESLYRYLLDSKSFV